MSRCKVCHLASERKRQAETQIEEGISLRTIASHLRESGVALSHASLHRHKMHHMHIPKKTDRELDAYLAYLLGSQTEPRHYRLSLVIEEGLLHALQRKQRDLQAKMEAHGHRRRVSFSSILDYFIARGYQYMGEDRPRWKRLWEEWLNLRSKLGFLRDMRSKRKRWEVRTVSLSKSCHDTIRFGIRRLLYNKMGFHIDVESSKLMMFGREWPDFSFLTPSTSDLANLMLRVGLRLNCRNRYHS